MEVYHNGEWGTVCDYGWDWIDAQVVCNELGLGNAINVTVGAFYGEGSGQIWLDYLQCVGTERTIGNCSHRGWGKEYCAHSQDAGVKCNSGMLTFLLFFHIDKTLYTESTYIATSFITDFATDIVYFNLDTYTH